jgi:hypothetical protein
MAAYKDPSFNERMALAQQTRQKALDRLRAKPPVDPEILAQRNAARLIREQAEAEARAAKQAAREQAKLERQNQQEAAQAAAAVAVPTEAELKAARDARYAARKKRKASR